ncbi:nitronate monooxygenase [Streptomyces sp. HUCO-GS316]|uniref:nitronate monooxygenase n=1 Tax=Streptomyces sp. HUCO-GS316 TaxID=2692198 RepID=UPI001369877E|nr:nitronate monooxygenase [Streptomyces sp. HUCO-GS316]MXM64575.1 nitronate monooxygenase [Streptomyces sp. HUCO-GS316]
MNAPRAATDLPWLIQGGMGVGVSGWRLARAVARTGQLGVVSGTALDTLLIRVLQSGDPGGHLRRALAAFPVPELAGALRERYFVEGGITPEERFAATPMMTADEGCPARSLTVVANFCEVWLAKEGHDGPVGINYLEKVQLATVPAMFGAILAGVDHVLVGAGIPAQIPGIATGLAKGEPVTARVDVEGDERPLELRFDPASILSGAEPGRLAPLRRPGVLAIVSLPALASYLNRDEETRPDGFVVEGPTAGGHSAPPRGPLSLDEHGDPVYGPRDIPDFTKMSRLGLPFWIAGGRCGPEQVREARAAGAAGVQLGSVFALCEESGMDAGLRRQLMERERAGRLRVRNDPAASPTSFPFKVAELPGTLADREVSAARARVCDLGYLRTPFRTARGNIDYRCPAEPLAAYVRKGGDAEGTEGRQCLCNGLLAAVGLGQRRPRGVVEPPVVTIGQDLDFLRHIAPDGSPYSAESVVRWLSTGLTEPADASRH